MAGAPMVEVRRWWSSAVIVGGQDGPLRMPWEHQCDEIEGRCRYDDATWSTGYIYCAESYTMTCCTGHC